MKGVKSMICCDVVLMIVEESGHKKISYTKTSNIRHTKSQHLNISRLVLQFFPNLMKPGVKSSMSPVSAAPTTSKWSTILLPIKVCLILEVRHYFVVIIVSA